MDEQIIERRAHPRYKVKKNILLYNEITFAEIINISKGGVFCKFMVEAKDQHCACTSVDLLNTADRHYVQHLPCRDLTCHELGRCEPPTSTVIRDCRLQFLDLTTEKTEQLERFFSLAITDRV